MSVHPVKTATFSLSGFFIDAGVDFDIITLDINTKLGLTNLSYIAEVVTITVVDFIVTLRVVGLKDGVYTNTGIASTITFNNAENVNVPNQLLSVVSGFSLRELMETDTSIGVTIKNMYEDNQEFVLRISFEPGTTTGHVPNTMSFGSETQIFGV